MSDFDERIRGAFSADATTSPQREREETLRFMVAETFSGKQRWLTILTWTSQLVFVVLTVVVAIRFFQVDESRPQIMYATLFLVCVGTVNMLKLWYWMMLNRNSLKREIKRLELQVAGLRDDVNARREA